MANSVTSKRALVISYAAATLSPIIGTTLWSIPATAQLVGVEEVIVTARRREERLQDVPEAISAMTSQDLESRNITDLRNVAALVPSFTLSNYQAQKNVRYGQTLLVRGVARSGTGIFIDGAPADPLSTPITDLERIEVLKGPQNAYFGRSTFAGALNYVTKTPSENWGGTAEGVVGTYALLDFRGSVEGPIVPEALTFRVAGRAFSQHGQYKNHFDGGRMTDQQTHSLSAALDYHKGDNLRIKNTFLYNVNHDGFPMVAKFKQNNFNCNAGLAPAGQFNYLCGELPDFPTAQLGMSYYLTPDIRNILFNNSLKFPNPSNVTPEIDGFESLIYGMSNILKVDYTFGSGFLADTTLSYLGSVYGLKSNQMINPTAEDTSATPNPNYGRIVGALPSAGTQLLVYGGWNYNIYHEVRITGDGKKRLRWMAGASYSRPINRVYGMNYGLTTTGPAAFQTDYNNFNQTYTTPIGIFSSVAYDITDALTANAEFRYQYDSIKVIRIMPQPNIELARAESWKLMPRVSLQYKFDRNMNVYASWARGFQPQSFNATLFTQTQSVVNFVLQSTGAGKTVAGEQIDMYEVGVKGNFLDNRLVVNTDLYYGKWTNQVIQQRVPAPNTSNPAVPTVVTVNTNLGETELKGWELDATASLTEKLLAKITFAYNGVTIKKYNCAACILNLTGVGDLSGKRLSGSPTTSGSVFLEYRDTFNSSGDWYLNTQFIYAGKIYADDVNLAWTKPRTTFDFRAGLDFGKTSVEAFIINAFNASYYESALRDVNGFAPVAPANAFNNAIYVGPGEKRRVGLRVKYRWGG